MNTTAIANSLPVAAVSSVARLYRRLTVAVLDRTMHARTAGYWFVVQAEGLPHVAFKTRAGLLNFLMERRLMLTRPLTEPGVYSWQEIRGSYRDISHYGADALATFAVIEPVLITRTVSNAQYVEARITVDPDGICSVHSLNPNVSDRPTLDYAESDKFIG